MREKDEGDGGSPFERVSFDAREEWGRAARPGECRDKATYSSAKRLLLLDLLSRSGLAVTDFADLVGVTSTTLYHWRKKLEEEGAEGLLDRRRGGRTGSRLPEVTRRAVLMIKESHPEYGEDRISALLGRDPALQASPGAVRRALAEAGWEPSGRQKPPVHRDQVRRFERARPNQLWQTDVFTFVMKRQGKRLYLVAFLDDHSRYVTSYGLHPTMSAALVLETFQAGVTAYGLPGEVLSDQGPQYHAWRGKSRFTKEMERLGVNHIVARPRHPQTVGKAERFWGTLWRECVSGAVFLDLPDARKRIGHFIDHYNFRRPHQGIENLVPADRFFGAAPEVRKTLEARVQANALALARDGVPRKPFYLTGRVGDVDLSIHAEGERVVLSTADGRREEVDLRASGRRAEPGNEQESVPEPVAAQGRSPHEPFEDEGELPPGRWPLDEALRGEGDFFEMNGTEDYDGRDDETEGAGEMEEAEAGRERGARERGGAAYGVCDPGGGERGARGVRGGGGARDLADALLRAGGSRPAGHGDGAGAEAAWTARPEARGQAPEGGRGAGPAGAGRGAPAVPAASRAQGIQAGGAQGRGQGQGQGQEAAQVEDPGQGSRGEAPEDGADLFWRDGVLDDAD
ncbi:MAG TPA: DDE-type integrase/transposase/recombinase [Polyangia bacterium]|nr:DDE-type integrase/transposase/recombinase [Polyangia bacterium]